MGKLKEQTQDEVFVLVDWAGNRLHPSKDFPTFDDGWDFISSNYEEEDHQELSIIPYEEWKRFQL